MFKNDFGLYTRLVSRSRKQLPLFILCTLLNGTALFLIFSSVGVLLMQVFAMVTNPADYKGFESILLYLGGICIFALVGACSLTGFTYIEEKTKIALRKEIVDGYIYADEAYSSKLSSTEVLNRINFDLPCAVNLIGYYMSGWIFQPFLSAVLSIAVLIYVNWIVAVVCILCGALNMCILKFAAENIKKSSEQMTVCKSKVVDFQYDCAEGIDEIHGFRAFPEFKKLLSANLSPFKKATISYHKYEGTRSAIMVYIADCVSVVAILIMGALLTQAGYIQFEYIMLALPLVGQIGEGMIAVTNFAVMLKMFSPNANRVFEVIDLPGEEPKSTDTANAMDSVRAFGKVSFDDVDFSYEKKNVLKNISFAINAGEKVAFVGESGSGKSTILKLLLGLYLPDDGSITMDDFGLRAETRLKWRRCFSYMSQEILAFNATVGDNIALSDYHPCENQVREAAKAAGIDDVIASSDLGYETMLDGKNNSFSGGQLQRISLARTLFQNRNILLLDEPTSALDDESERIMRDMIQKTDHNKTVIVVTHRLRFVEHFDRIYAMRNGQIVEAGTHEELMDKKGYYSELYNLQNQ